MSNEFQHKSLEDLIASYKKEACELREALLEGASWKELKEKSAIVTQLSIEIHRKNPTYFKSCNPAENPMDRSGSLEP